jgi:hypothetical protein
MAIFKIEACGDTVYIEAETKQLAKNELFAHMGAIPEKLLKWSEVAELPEGEELL